MLNLQICTVIIMTKKNIKKKKNNKKSKKKKKKKKKKSCDPRESNPGHKWVLNPRPHPLRHGGRCELQIKIINILLSYNSQFSYLPYICHIESDAMTSQPIAT